VRQPHGTVGAHRSAPCDGDPDHVLVSMTKRPRRDGCRWRALRRLENRPRWRWSISHGVTTVQRPEGCYRSDAPDMSGREWSYGNARRESTRCRCCCWTSKDAWRIASPASRRWPTNTSQAVQLGRGGCAGCVRWRRTGVKTETSGASS